MDFLLRLASAEFQVVGREVGDHQGLGLFREICITNALARLNPVDELRSLSDGIPALWFYRPPNQPEFRQLTVIAETKPDAATSAKTDGWYAVEGADKENFAGDNGGDALALRLVEIVTPVNATGVKQVV